MEEPQQQHQTRNPTGGGDRRVSVVRNRRGAPTNRPRVRHPLSLRCVLIRNLPKGFVGRSDLVDKNTPIRVRRVVYCEESNGSIMMEFASEAERNQILALDQQRRRRIRQRIQDQPTTLEDTNIVDNTINNSSSNNNSDNKPHAFEIKVTVERCTSERFVRTVLHGVSSTARRTGMTPRSSDQQDSSRLVRRCIVIRKIVPPDYTEVDSDIPEAPPYDRRMRGADDASIMSGDTHSSYQQQRPPAPMEIRSGSLCEVVVRGATLHNKSNMNPAMLVELQSEESVERILLAEDAKQADENAPKTTLAIPVELHAVKSKRYAELCFGNLPRANVRRNRDRGANTTKFQEDDDNNNEGAQGDNNHSIDADETMEIQENGDCGMNGETAEENGGSDDIAEEEEPQTPEERIKMLEKEVRDTRAEMGRWRARAKASKHELTQFRSNGGSSSKTDEMGGLPESEVTASSSDDDNSQNPASSSTGQTQTGESEEPNHQQEWLGERQVLEEQIRDLLAENDRLKGEGASASAQESNNESPEASPEDLLAENDKLKARIAEIETMESEVEEFKARQKQAEEARNKLEEENSGLLRYVLELEGHRSGQALADEERLKELEKKHSDLSTLYRFVQAQAEQSAKDLRNEIEEKEKITAELEGFKTAWRTRMETQRRLEESKDKDGDVYHVCIECETIRFHSALEESMSSEEDDEAQPGECSPKPSVENGHSLSESEAAAVAAQMAQERTIIEGL